MKLPITLWILAGSIDTVTSFSSFAFNNQNNNNNNNNNKSNNLSEQSSSESTKKGWDPSPFQQQSEPEMIEDSDDSSVNNWNPSFPPPSSMTSNNDNENEESSSTPHPPPPVPFAASKVLAENTDMITNPLIRPIAFTNNEKRKVPTIRATTTTTTTTPTTPSFHEIMNDQSLFITNVAPTINKELPLPTSNSIIATDDNVEKEGIESSSPTENPSKGQKSQSSSPLLGNKDNDDDDDDLVLGDDSTVTERMFKKVCTTTDDNQTTGGAGGGPSTLEAFQRAEANWKRLKAFQPFHYDKKLLRWTQDDGHGPPPQFVATDGAFGSLRCWEKLRQSVMEEKKDLDYDVVVCGGTLGIFFAMYLQLQGHDVCVVEAGQLRGREQEWNISMDELLELKTLGIITQEDIDAVITTEFPACRSGFKNQEITPLEGGYFENGVGYECFTPDVLNLGVAPALLLERVSKRFQTIGGVIMEQTRLAGVCVSELVGAAVDLGEDKEPITARLVLDCMGNASPISAQQRYGKKADGICCVVGSCAGGFEAQTNLLGDIIYTNQPIVSRKNKGSNQYFWEAFPVGIGRGKEPGTSDVKTTYMFTYMDADENRPSLLDIFEDYWKLLPVYQPSIQNPETDLDVKRILFAYFPTYKDSPLQPEFSRVLAVGDASGIQSPLSFGGFGALTRHLGRVGGAISDALENDCLHKEDLSRINDYQPNLSAAWMFQKAMSQSMGQNVVDPKFVNRLLATNFEVMNSMGPRTIRPFLQDVVRFDGLLGSLTRSFIADPAFMPQIVSTVGIPELVKWMGHVAKMGQYSLLDSTASSPFVTDFVDKYVTDPRKRFQWMRTLESWKFGSGNDYKFPEDERS